MVFILFSWFYGTFLNRVFIAMLDYLRVVEATEPAAPHVPGYQRRGAPGGPWGSQHDFIYVYVCSYIDIYIMGWFSSMFLRIGWFSTCSTVLYEEFRAPARCSKGSFLARQLVPGNPWISIFSVRRNLKILETPCPSLRGDVRRMQGMARHGTAERWIAYLAWRGLNRINRDVQIFRMVGDFVRQRRQPLMNYIYIYMQYYIILYARSWFML